MKQVIISPNKANCMFWLGRYTERIYLQLHLLRRCFDRMIDGKDDELQKYVTAIGCPVSYPDFKAGRIGLMFDKENPVSVLSCIEMANDNAVILRDEIMSPTLGYVQMSLEFLRNKAKEGNDTDIDELQTLTDWMLAFWGSIAERVFDERVRTFLMIGKLIEHIDMNIRFGYKHYRIEEAYISLLKCYGSEPRAFDKDVLEELSPMLLNEENYAPNDPNYLSKVLSLLGKVVIL